MSEGYLPPVVIQFTGDLRDLLAKIKEAQSALDDFSKTVSTAHLSADYKLVTKAITEADAELKGFAKQVFDAHLGATTGPLQGKLAAADAELKQWGSKVTNTQLGANSAVLQKDLLKINAELAKWGSKVTKTQLSADQTLLLGQLAKASTELSALAKKVTKLPVTADTKAALASAALAQQAINRMQADITVGANVAGAAAKIAALDAAIKAMNEAASGGGGGAAGKTGLRRLVALLGLTGTFSLLGSLGGHLAGISPERVLTTLAGIAGFVAAAGAGGALLATAAGVTTGVGLGTDMAGIGQAAGDVQKLFQATNNLQGVVAIYGKNSAQAKLAQQEYNQTLAGMPAVARTAIKAATSAALSWTPVFDKYTGPAEAIGADIITQAIGAVEKLLPEIGTAATRNMHLIQEALQPFLTWLDSAKAGGGISVLTEIENTFSKNLPNSMTALTRAFEALFLITQKLDPQTGKLTADFAKFFTSITTPTPPPKPTWHPGESMKAYANAMKVWQTEVSNDQYGLSNAANSKINQWVADWHVLTKFGMALLHAGEAIAKASQGTGKSIFTTLTDALDSFTAWAETKKGHASLANLMNAHKKQLDALLSLAGALIGMFGKFELAVSPTIVNALTTALRALNTLFDMKYGDIGGFASFAAITGLLLVKIPLLKNALSGLLGVLTGKITTPGGFWSVLTGKGSASTQFSASVKLFSEAVTKFSTRSNIPTGPGGTPVGTAETAANDTADAGIVTIALRKLGLGGLADILTKLAGAAGSLSGVGYLLFNQGKLVAGLISKYGFHLTLPDLTKLLKPTSTQAAINAQVQSYVGQAGGVWTSTFISSVLPNLLGELLKAGLSNKEIVAALLTLPGMTAQRLAGILGNLDPALAKIAAAIAKGTPATTTPTTPSPSQLQSWASLLEKATAGILSGHPLPASQAAAGNKAMSEFGLLGNVKLSKVSTQQITAYLNDLLGGNTQGAAAILAKMIGESAGQGIAQGLNDSKAPTAAMVTKANDIVKAAATTLGIKSPSKVFKDQIGMPAMQGLALGITANAGLVQAAMMSVVDKTLKSLTAELPRFKSAGAGLTASLLAGAGSVPAFHGAGVVGGNIEITSHITFQLTGMPDMTHGSTFSRQLKSALDEHDRKLVQAIRSGRS